MGSEEWRHKQKKQKPSSTLANWCDANLPLKMGRKVALLVSKSEASPRVVGILKTHRARNEVLSKAQRVALEAEVNGAGSWSATAATAPTGGSATPRPTRRAAFSDDAKNSSRSYASVAAGAKDPKLLATERKLATALKEAKDAKEELKRSAAAAVHGGAAAAAVDEEMGGQEAKQWECESCGARHRKHMRSCRICAIPRVAATLLTGSAAPHSPEETEAKYAKLSEQLTVLKSIVPAELVAKAIAGLQAQMVQLKAQPAAAAVKTVRESYDQAQEALDEVETRQEALVAKSGNLHDRLDELLQDLDAAGRALDLVNEEQTAALAHRDAAMLAVRGPTVGTEAAATTAPSAAAAAAAAILEYKAKVCGLLMGTTLPEFNEAYLKYKETDAVGVVPMGEVEFIFTALKKQLEVQADEQLASVSASALQESQTHQGEPASPASAEATVTQATGLTARSGGLQAPDVASMPTVVVGAAPRDPDDGQLGQRAGAQRIDIKITSLEACKAKFEMSRVVVEQRKATRGEKIAAKRSEDY